MQEMRLIRRCLVLAALMLTALPVSLLAQDGKNIRTVLFVRLKPERTGDWRAAVKDYAALMKKSGSEEYFTVWASQSGPDEYAVVWNSARWKDLDEEQDPKTKDVAVDIAHVIARLDGATQSLETWVDERQPDLAISGKDVPKFVRTGRTRVVPSKMTEVLEILKSDTVPALKKAGITEFGVYVARYGTPINEIHTYAAIGGWGDLDAPWGIQKALSAEEYKAYLAKITPDLVFSEYDIWRFKPELSYVPEPKQ
jgi:quinol monooxygenase YgiN